jgi:hypothetical protein
MAKPAAVAVPGRRGAAHVAPRGIPRASLRTDANRHSTGHDKNGRFIVCT